MVRLTCVVIQEGSTISIVIDEGLPVYELKKAIKAKRPNDLKDVDAAILHLFLAKDDGDAWLGASSEVARQLQNGEMPDAIKTLVQKDKELLGGSDIKFMWQGMNPPANDQIHVLVKLPEKFVPNKRPRWTTGVEAYEPKINKLVTVPRIDIDNNEKYVKLPAALLRACGLFSDHDLMLYRRSGVNDVWTYLRNDVVTGNKRPFVVGPAGVGKSTCVLSFAASLVADKLDASSIAYEVNAEDASDKEKESEQKKKKKQDLKSKFYYAGGSCRFMFQYTTDAVKSALEAAVRSTRNKMDLVNYCRSTIHSDKINVLYGMQRDGAVGRRYPVSSFAAYLMAEDSDEEVIAKLKKYLT